MKRLSLSLLVLLLAIPLVPVALAQEDATATLVEGNTAFAFDLYSAIRSGPDGNLLISPYSISQALAMTYAGAGGNTEAQMADTLHFSLPQDQLHAAFGALNGDLDARGNAPEDPESGQPERVMLLANALWGEQTYPFDPAYLALLDQSYGTGLQPTDFKNAPEAARQEINGWVAEHTRDRIQDIVPPDGINKDTPLVLADAIYFYGGWQEPFDPNATSDDQFHLLEGTTVSVPFMSQLETFAYLQGDGFQLIDLPYAGSGLTFTIILPDEGRFEAVEAGLNAGTLDAAITEATYREVQLYLPKFEFTFGTIDLVEPLQSLGMTDAFNWNSADFLGMTEESALQLDQAQPLYIDKVFHKTFIQVDEQGTEAAAASVVVMGSAGAAPPQEPVNVRIDRPFLFAIRDTQSGTLLFLGRVMDPSVTT